MLEGLLIFTFAHYGSKMIYRKMNDSHELFNKILNDGLYHIRSKETAYKIFDSPTPQKIFSSGYFASYGKRKAFFFPGIPSFELLLENCRTMMSPTVTALKLKPTYEELASFRVREYNDWVISYDGNVDPQKYKPSKEVVQYFQNQNSFLFRVKKDLQSYGIDIKFFYNNALKRILLTGWQLCKSKEAFEKGKSL